MEAEAVEEEGMALGSLGKHSKLLHLRGNKSCPRTYKQHKTKHKQNV